MGMQGGTKKAWRHGEEAWRRSNHLSPCANGAPLRCHLSPRENCIVVLALILQQRVRCVCAREVRGVATIGCAERAAEEGRGHLHACGADVRACNSPRGKASRALTGRTLSTTIGSTCSSMLECDEEGCTRADFQVAKVRNGGPSFEAIQRSSKRSKLSCRQRASDPETIHTTLLGRDPSEQVCRPRVRPTSDPCPELGGAWRLRRSSSSSQSVTRGSQRTPQRCEDRNVRARGAPCQAHKTYGSVRAASWQPKHRTYSMPDVQSPLNCPGPRTAPMQPHGVCVAGGLHTESMQGSLDGL
jgi:hypothetical protein